jgi:hypothetical protein
MMLKLLPAFAVAVTAVVSNSAALAAPVWIAVGDAAWAELR